MVSVIAGHPYVSLRLQLYMMMKLMPLFAQTLLQAKPSYMWRSGEAECWLNTPTNIVCWLKTHEYTTVCCCTTPSMLMRTH